MQFEGNESELHPLVVTAVPRHGEDSVDFGSGDRGPLSEDEHTQRLFGFPTIDTQGPAGSRVPDADDRPRRRFGDDEGDPKFRYLGDPDAPPDAAGPNPLMDAEMTEADYQDPAADAAAAALAAVHRQGQHSSAAMLDALEAAETAYEQQHKAGSGTRHGLSHKLGRVEGGRGAAAAGADVRPPDTPRKAAIPEATRERMIEAVFESLQHNPRYSCEPTRDVMSAAQEVEDELFTSSHSKQVYLSKVSNAVRLARSVQDATDIPRIASGEPRKLAEGHTAGEPSPYVTGLQGYVLKPDALQG